jgi:hypothetical protein
MDDSTQKQNNTSDVAQVPATPVSVPNKEVELAPVSDYLAPSAEIESIIKDKEVAEAGIKETSQTPSLTKEHFNVGIKHSAESTPVQRESTGQVKLPMTQNQAEQQAKGNTDDATTWLANFILRFLKKMRIGNTVS